MKKFFSIFTAVLFAGSMMADSYTVIFKDAGEGKSDGSSILTSSNVADYVAKGAEYFSTVEASGNVYLGQGGYGLKFGNKSNPGSITLTLATPVTPTSIVMNASPWSGTEGSGLLQDSIFATKSTGAKGTFGDFTYYYDGATQINTIVVGTSTKRGYVKSITINYEAGAAPAVSTPVITGEKSFYETAEISIACSTEGANVYYTLDGAEPTAESALYADPFVINATTTVKAIAIKGEDKSDVATKTFTKKEPLVAISCAEVYSKAKGDELALNNVVVAYANGKNVYVQDETGSMLLYLTKNTTWEAGNILSGVQGTLDIYNGLYEVKMTDAQATSVQPGQGEAPAPAEFNAAPVAADMNKYIVLKNVTVSAETFPSNKNMDCTIGEESFVLRNNFNANAAFDITKKYDIIGVVAVYNSTVQVYFISAEKVQATAINNNTVADKVQKVVRDGQLYIIRDGKMINVLGAQF